MNQIEVSIILPVYNSEKYIEKSVESILNQEFQNFELIIINDGSTDQSLNIIKEKFQTKKIILIDRKENKGLPYSLNEGIKISRGDYIARMDADDISLPSRLGTQYDFLEKNKNIALVGSDYLVFNDFGIIKKAQHPSNIFEIKWEIIFDTVFCHPSVFFRKDIITSIGFYKNCEAEDFDLFSRILFNFNGTNLNQVLINYREHSNNRSFTVKEKLEKSVFLTYSENYRKYKIRCSENELRKMFLFKKNKMSLLNEIYYAPYFLINSFKILLIIKKNNNKKIFEFLSLWLLKILIPTLSRIIKKILKRIV